MSDPLPEPHTLPHTPRMPQSAADSTPVPAGQTPGTQALADTGQHPAAGGATCPLTSGTLLEDRFEVREQVGSGGMGVVLRVFDRALERELAIKVMKRGVAGDPESVRRFLEEAKICGQLQHPGIVPLHEVGRLSDGTPFFTMKLVRGSTLADLLKGRPNPTVDLPRMVQVFEQVCQAVAYAHSQGVVHRDLKPANVMVGAFGEVQVMDWGLAKVLVPREHAAPAAWADVTASGSILGTPAYMPPEQARGIIERVDQRSDVFALGAILCEILTGQPPYIGRQSDAHAQAADGSIDPALERLGRSGADAKLVAIAVACLQPTPGGRPSDAAAVAGLVSAYSKQVELAARQAREDQAAAQARAEEAQARAVAEAQARAASQEKVYAERRARRTTLALTATVVLVVVGGGGGLWWAQQHRSTSGARQQETDSTTSATLRQARALREQARANPLKEEAKFREAQSFGETALQLAHEGSGALVSEAEELLNAIRDDIAQVGGYRTLLAAWLDVHQPREAPHFRSNETRGGVRVSPPSADEQFGSALRAWGLDVDQVTAAQVVAGFQGLPEPVVQELVAGLDEWADERRSAKRPEADWRKLAEIANLLDVSERRKRLRAIRLGDELRREQIIGILTGELLPWSGLTGEIYGTQRKLLQAMAAEVKPAEEPVLALVSLAQLLQMHNEPTRAEILIRSALEARPGDVLLLDTLGRLLEGNSPPRYAEAVECYRAAREVRPELGVALANALRLAKRAPEAEGVLVELARQRPDNAGIYLYLGLALNQQGKHADAIAAYRKVIALQPAIPEAHNNLAVALEEQGEHTQAEAALRQALALRPDYRAARSNLGTILEGRQKPRGGQEEQVVAAPPKERLPQPREVAEPRQKPRGGQEEEQIAAALGKAILEAVHPTSAKPSLVSYSTKTVGGDLVLTMKVSWKGGFAGTPFESDIKVTFDGKKIDAIDYSDDAIIPYSKNGIQRFKRRFNEKVED